MTEAPTFRRRVVPRPAVEPPSGEQHGPGLPLVVRGNGSQDPVAYARSHSSELTAALHTTGAVLLRGFGDGSAPQLRAVVDTVLPGQLLDYTERSSPRSLVLDKVFTSTEHPADQDILLHNENAYQAAFPRLVAFWCRSPAGTGGSGTLADVRTVRAALPADLVATFDAQGVRYVRHFGLGVGLGWEETFGTDDRGRVSDYCTEHGLQAHWDGEVLRTTAQRAATLSTPTGPSWFNHVVFFHPRSLPDEVRGELEAQLGDRLPNSVTYGDGRDIPDATIDTLRAAYDAARTSVRYQRGDILLIDNTLVAHGRERFTGPREILVSMAGHTRWDDAS